MEDEACVWGGGVDGSSEIDPRFACADADVERTRRDDLGKSIEEAARRCGSVLAASTGVIYYDPI
jgi:hypothetical protein